MLIFIGICAVCLAIIGLFLWVKWSDDYVHPLDRERKVM